MVIFVIDMYIYIYIYIYMQKYNKKSNLKQIEDYISIGFSELHPSFI